MRQNTLLQSAIHWVPAGSISPQPLSSARADFPTGRKQKRDHPYVLRSLPQGPWEPGRKSPTIRRSGAFASSRRNCLPRRRHGLVLRQHCVP